MHTWYRQYYCMRDEIHSTPTLFHFIHIHSRALYSPFSRGFIGISTQRTTFEIFPWNKHDSAKIYSHLTYWNCMFTMLLWPGRWAHARTLQFYISHLHAPTKKKQPEYLFLCIFMKNDDFMKLQNLKHRTYTLLTVKICTSSVRASAPNGELNCV